MMNRQFPVEKMRTDLLIIGAEGAGCMAAVGAEDPNLSITMVTKGQWGDSHVCLVTPDKPQHCFRMRSPIPHGKCGLKAKLFQAK